MHDTWSMLHVTFDYWHWHKIQSHQFGNPYFGTLARPFHFRQWLRVCAVKIDASYLGIPFSKCQQVLGHACHIWYSLACWGWSHWPMTIEHVRAQWGSVVSWRACSTKSEQAARVFRSIRIFLNWLKKCVISLRWCCIKAVHKRYACGGGTHYVKVMGRLRGIDPPFSRYWERCRRNIDLDLPFFRILRGKVNFRPLFSPIHRL